MGDQLTCHGIISSWQSAATSETVNLFWYKPELSKQHYTKYLDFHLYKAEIQTVKRLIASKMLLLMTKMMTMI